MNSQSPQTDNLFFGFTRYQLLVLFAAWLGWGFDVFDAILFNYVSRICLPVLLPSSENTPQHIVQWTGIITSILLVGWGIGGIAFGRITDKIGRKRALLFTILTYALATAACAFAPNIYFLILCRFIASLGIGGEWAAGASLVAETVPENRRVQAGALLYTAAPAGLFLATFVTDLFTNQISYFASNPDISWRAVFLTGLIPAIVAFWIRSKINEPEGWTAQESRPRLRQLFTPELRRRTIGGMVAATVALITWWSANAFIPVISSVLAEIAAPAHTGLALGELKAQFVRTGTLWFNLGGLVGTLLTIPIALHLGRRPMFLGYFAISAISIWGTYQLNFLPETRLIAMFFIGVSVFGVIGAFPFYLPELFPMRLRATGAGLCFNAGRFITALGPFIVGDLARRSASSDAILQVVSWVAIIPALGVLLMLCGLVEETQGHELT